MLAHSGHWLVNLIYLVPIVGVAVVVFMQARRDRRNGRAGVDEGDQASLDDVMDGRA